MVELFIDTSNVETNVALIQNNKIISRVSEISGTTLSTRLLDIVDKVFKNTNLSVQDIEKIYVVNGPGSFTGIRVGVSVAKTLAWALKINIICISELELMASTDFNTDYIIPIIDARRNSSFNAIYDKNLNIVISDRYSTNDDIKNNILENNSYTFVSYTNIDGFNILSPSLDIIKVIEKHRDDVSVNPHSVNPKYLKLTEAEENLEKN